jgi:Na+:H+ antiporter, NhaA family
MTRRIAPLRDFFNRESTSGLLILLASALGLITANSPLSDSYFSTLDFKLTFGADWYLIDLSILKVINYLLMSIFFFVVGLEIKRELTSGHLASLKKALLPFIAAIGGMAVPALIYLAIAGGVAPGGWGVPVATDIALASWITQPCLDHRLRLHLRSFLLALSRD